MQFNSAKCKFMLVLRRRNTTTPSPPLCLNGSPLESVPTFKYLSVLLSSDLTWPKHVQSICSRACKLIGLLYRRYYQYSDCNILLQLYLSLVCPLTEYAAPVWDPHLLSDINSLENVQKFALHVCCKQWDILNSWAEEMYLHLKIVVSTCNCVTCLKSLINICYSWRVDEGEEHLQGCSSHCATNWYIMLAFNCNLLCCNVGIFR